MIKQDAEDRFVEGQSEENSIMMMMSMLQMKSDSWSHQLLLMVTLLTASAIKKEKSPATRHPYYTMLPRPRVDQIQRKTSCIFLA